MFCSITKNSVGSWLVVLISDKLVIDCAVGNSSGFGKHPLCVLEQPDAWLLHRCSVLNAFAFYNWLLTPGFTPRA